jgi:hypothetical protein
MRVDGDAMVVEELSRGYVGLLRDFFLVLFF